MNGTKYWIALEQTHGIGPAQMVEVHSALKERGLSLGDLCDLSAEEIRGEFGFNDRLAGALAGLRGMTDTTEENYIKLLESGVEAIPFFSESYPHRLREVMGSGIPPFLYTWGNRDLLNRRGVALLGDRDVSDRGARIAFEASRLLSRHAITVIGGFARGVGLLAHRAALLHEGTTVAVVPYGMFHFSLPDMLGEVMDLARAAIVSPFYPTVEPDRYHAYARNRVICALSRAVYIIEAPGEGGIFEAAKSARTLGVPLYTTEYAEYPKNAGGNRIIIEEMEGIPVLGKIENDALVPQMDGIIGTAKFG
ncbi:MAG: DNA-processing protein DprA [Spirochaetes bacterium]|nr:DNA-processing protein DprA [Spirochaetota bacterium]